MPRLSARRCAPALATDHAEAMKLSCGCAGMLPGSGNTGVGAGSSAGPPLPPLQALGRAGEATLPSSSPAD